MRPLQILTNKYLSQQQELEYQLEKEINAPYPDVDLLDDILYQLSILETKHGYLNHLLTNITHARTDNNTADQPTE